MEQVRVAPGRGPRDLPQRLRDETADLHRQVEDTVGLPGSVGCRDDYARLLGRLHGFHTSVERRLSAPEWDGSWAQVGLDLDRHRRTAQLAADLAVMGRPVPQAPADVPLPSVTGFGEALGALYVLEGSALGGRMLAPMITEAVGDVPTAFLRSEGRDHPRPWRAVQRALRRYEERGGDADEVVRGARETFVGFGRHVAGQGVPAAAR